MAQAANRLGSHLGIRIALLVTLLVASIALGFAIPNATADTLVTSEATSIIARVPNPMGGGASLSVIRDGDKPAAGTSSSSRQYDSWDGANSASEDWVGYTFSGTRTFTRVVFQEGMHFWDGGWFLSLTVQVRQNGTWVNVQGLSTSPAYGGNNGNTYQTYTLSFTQITGDAIRIYGAPGGSAAFISIGELEVYATASGSGAAASSTTSGAITSQATSIIARVPNPQGGGAPLSVIRDGDKPAAGTSSSSRQYDSWDGANSASEDWVGYTFSGTRTFTRVVFQEGMHFWDGGWFLSLTVQVRQNGSWVNVQGLSTSPAYAGNNGVTYQTYTLSFTPITGDAIRIYGAPGGSAAFISVAELEVYASGSSTTTTTTSTGGSAPPANSTGATFFTATNGSDSNPGSESQPFRTVNKGASVLRPGDILYIKQGTYAEALIHNIPRGNSWTQAVTIAAYPGHVVTLRPSGTGSVLRFIEPQQYIIVRGLVLDAGGVAGDVVKITSSGSGSAAHHIRIDDCEVKNGTMNGIMTTDGAHSNEFIGLDVHDNGRSDFNHGMYLSTDSNLVEGSDVHANAGWGIHIYSAYGSTSNNVVRRNRLYNNARVGGRGSGVLVSSGSGHQVYNNLVWGNYAGIDAWSRAQNVLIANNVVYANRWVGIFVVSGAVNTRVQNNITWQNGDGDDYANQGSGTTQNFNLIGVDPHFVNADGADFHLRSDSPAIDRGTAISSVTVDYDGVSRPQHNAVDIGAFEWR